AAFAKARNRYRHHAQAVIKIAAKRARLSSALLASVGRGQDAYVGPKRSKPADTSKRVAEHLTRSARDLTIIQTSALTLVEAVDLVDAAVPDGFVFWAIPTIRDGRAGYGIYTYDARGQVHYFFAG